MPQSLKTLLSKLRYKGQISGDEYKALLEKLKGHDSKIAEEAYKRGHAEAMKSIKPTIKEIHDGVYNEGIKAGREMFYDEIHDEVEILNSLCVEYFCKWNITKELTELETLGLDISSRGMQTLGAILDKEPE